MGRPPKPVELKRRTGRNPTTAANGSKLPAPVVQLVASKDVPRPPETLGKAGVKAWDDLWGEGHTWLTPADVHILTMLCEAFDEREALCAQIAEDGYMIPGSMGQSRVHPLVPQKRALEAQITSWLASCGFDPSSRARLGYAQVQGASALEEMMRRRAGGS